ncbi:MAG: sigma 54-interacting transcriptional regulator [Polyangiaceae bacterium]|nr:sigma 54-interacting transcriptional regulator [Polyangiaceae bacterium]
MPFADTNDLRSLGDENSTVMHARFDPTPASKAFRLKVVDGPDKGLEIRLDGSQASRILVGQGPACDIRLTDPMVSRRHVALEPTGQRVRIVDLGSKNGTFVGELPILDAFLQGGELVRVGSTLFRLEAEGAASAPRLSQAMGFGRVLGASTEMRRLYPLCERLAASSVPVIIEGETGTGKELLAEAIHEQGPRAAAPFLVFDCTAVPVNLIETELFGHERGAFTGAVSSRRGVLEQAHGGTLLIDEIGDLDLSLQPKLLRAMERGEFRPIGGERVVKVDVRIIAATRRDLDREVQSGRFRDDLFHRLAVARIELPPLNRRRGDIAVLVQHFCEELGGDPALISQSLIARWEELPWPGNIRELRNTVARHLALGELASLELMERASGDEDAPPSSSPADGAALARVLDEALELPLGDARQRVVEQFERAYVRRMMSKHGGNVTRAAEGAQVARRYFQVLKAKLGKAPAG